MSEPKTIYCPGCGSEVAHYDGRATMNTIVNCKKCRKRIVYHTDSERIEMKPIPPRNCNGGMRFY